MILYSCVALGALVASWLITRKMCDHAPRLGLIDVPNARSSHTSAVARGGGLAIVCVTLAAAVALTASGHVDLSLGIALTVGGAIVAGVGLRDDYKPLRAVVRLAAHLVAASIAVYMLDGFSVLNFAGSDVALGWLAYPLSVVVIVWSINLFNFMDGIDGLAASQSAYVCLAGAGLAAVVDSSSPIIGPALVLGAASLGFLICNWPPARIFMGDVGSGFLGFAIAVLALAQGRNNPAAPFTWAILGAVFVSDATVTLVTRALSGQKVQQAHRSHAYQKLAMRVGAHRPVTVGVIALNILFLFPCAILAVLHPAHAVWLTAIAMVPLVIVALILRAGRAGS